MDKNFQGNFNRTKQMLLQTPELQAKRRPKDFEAEASKANSRWLSNFWLSRFSDTSWYSIRSIWKTFGLTDIFGEKFSTKFSHTDNLARPYSPSEMVRTLWFIWFIIWTSYPIIRGMYRYYPRSNKCFDWNLEERRSDQTVDFLSLWDSECLSGWKTSKSFAAKPSSPLVAFLGRQKIAQTLFSLRNSKMDWTGRRSQFWYLKS